MKTPSTTVPGAARRARLILSSLFLIAVLFPSVCQPLIIPVWSVLRRASFYRWSTFETIWTVFCYAAIEVPLTVVFTNHPEWRLTPPTSSRRTKPRGMRRPSRRLREALVYVAPLLAMDLTMVKKFHGVSLSAMLESGHYDHPPLATSPGNGSAGPVFRGPPETFLIPTFHNFTLASPLQLVRALPAEAPSSRRLALELVSSVVIYDALFFLFHLSLHVVPPLRRWHAPHHAHDAQLNPQVTNQLSVPERLGLVLLANLSLNLLGAHVLTRTAFVPVFVWLLVEIHCGMDLPWAYDKILPHGWGGGARKHMGHHRRGERDYEPFFCWWDQLWVRVAGSRRNDGTTDQMVGISGGS